MKINLSLVLLFLLTVSCTDSGTIGISKLPNFIKGSVCKTNNEAKVAVLKEIKMTVNGDSVLSQIEASVDLEGNFFFENVDKGDYVIVLNGETQSAVIQNIKFREDSLILEEVELKDHCSITGKVFGENIKKVFITGLASAEIIDSVYVLKNIPKGMVDVAITDGKTINVIPLEVNGNYDEFTVSSVEFLSEVSENSAEYSFYGKENNSFVIKSFVDSVGDVSAFFPDSTGNMETVYKNNKVLFDDFNSTGIYSLVNNDPKKDPIYGSWYDFVDKDEEDGSLLLTTFGDGSAKKNKNGNGQLYFVTVMGSGTPIYSGFGCHLTGKTKASTDLSNLKTLSFKGRGCGSLNVSFIPVKGYISDSVLSNFAKSVILDTAWQEFDLDVNDFEVTHGGADLLEGVKWEDVSNEILFLQFLIQGETGDTTIVEIDDIYFNGVSIDDFDK